MDGSIDTIKNVKLELESVLQKVAGEIATQVAITFGFSKTSSLGQALSERYSEEWSAKRNTDIQTKFAEISEFMLGMNCYDAIADEYYGGYQAVTLGN